MRLTMTLATLTTLAIACASGRPGFEGTDVDGNAAGGGDGPAGAFGEGGAGAPAVDTPDTTHDPVDCDEAKKLKSYVGCEYWPTVTANVVWSVFDFAVVVSNIGKTDADVGVTGPGGVATKVKVAAGAVEKVFLPWVPSLKGPDADECGAPQAMTASVVQPGGAYHLVSSVPVVVYQFNALQYQGKGGTSGKDWSQCVGSKKGCAYNGNQPIGCFSFSNDASLLLPSTAMTGSYRVVGQHGWSDMGSVPLLGSTLAITATDAATKVSVALAKTAAVVASSEGIITASNGGDILWFDLAKAGDVVELISQPGEEYDFSGSLVQANKPVQVIAGNPCINLPSTARACDHVEETVLPAETLGKRYVVTRPTGAKGAAVAHIVRLYGNKDGTTLTYTGGKPPACPTALSAGAVVDCGIVTNDFEVAGSEDFAVATFQLGAQYHDPLAVDRRGDPDASTFASVEQFRTKYALLAPDDYAVSFVDVTAPANADVVLDGQKVTTAPQVVGGGTFGVHRLKLEAGNKGGVHTLSANVPIGVQVVGYGDFTSYQYPGGLNLKLIAPPPPPATPK